METPTVEQLRAFAAFKGEPCEKCCGHDEKYLRESQAPFTTCPDCHGTGYPSMLARWMELEADKARIGSALERTLWNFELLLSGKPVREAAECIAEARAATEKGTKS